MGYIPPEPPSDFVNRSVPPPNRPRCSIPLLLLFIILLGAIVIALIVVHDSAKAPPAPVTVEQP